MRTPPQPARRQGAGKLGVDHRRRRTGAGSVHRRGVRSHHRRSLPVRRCRLGWQGRLSGNEGFLQKDRAKNRRTEDDRKRRRYRCKTHSPHSAEAARNPAISIMKATANQSSSVGMAKIMAHVGGYGVGTRVLGTSGCALQQTFSDFPCSIEGSCMVFLCARHFGARARTP